MTSQGTSGRRRVLEAANKASATTYKPIIMPLAGTYVAMIFRRGIKSASKLVKT
ncbi:hypothetical protein [uncultured Agrobacterium sp.]|uniref:hypothetical protein n=1 Tax=uncultured Agrobacterium sp. TaxID=157277 RepID=UPI0025EA9FAB|nr:hypothetical protein [uncultured Agrobacterium sp.]